MAYYDEINNKQQKQVSSPLSSQALPGATYGAQPQPTPKTGYVNTSAYDPFEAFRASNQTGSSEDVLRSAYKTFTGREADDAGLKAHLSNPGGLYGGVRSIYDSPEGQAYRTANPNNFSDPATRTAAPTAGTATTPTVGGATTPPAATTPAAVTPQIFQGFTPKYAMEGFDFAREQNTGKSAKDAFAYLANQAPPPPLNDKAALGAWFTQYIKPGMDALGHKVNSVNGDSFNFSNWQGTFDVDFGRGAGANGGALAWQVQEPTAKLSNAAYTPGVVLPTAPIDPTTGQPVPTSSAQQPISSAITYRRPYEGYVDAQPVPQP